MDKLLSSSNSCRGLRTALLLLLGTLLLTIPAAAQFHDRDLPAESVAWWTLTDELSPQQYRETYRDSSAALARYQSDVAEGEQEALAPDRAQALTFYINPANTPELMPVWFAFGVVSRLHLERLGRERLARTLTEAGLSELGSQLFLDSAERYQALFDEATAVIWPEQRKFIDFQERAQAALGGDLEAYRTFRSALTRSDAAFLAPLGGETVARTAELLAMAKTDPGLVAAQQLLPELREQLSTDDWSALRAYFLTEVVAGMGPLRVFEG